MVAKKKTAKAGAKKAAVKKPKAASRTAKTTVVKQKNDPWTALETQLKGVEQSLGELRNEFTHFQSTVVSSSRNLVHAFSGFRDALSFSGNPAAASVRDAATRLVDGVQGYIAQLQARVRKLT